MAGQDRLVENPATAPSSPENSLEPDDLMTKEARAQAQIHRWSSSLRRSASAWPASSRRRFCSRSHVRSSAVATPPCLNLIGEHVDDLRPYCARPRRHRSCRYGDPSHRRPELEPQHHHRVPACVRGSGVRLVSSENQCSGALSLLGIILQRSFFGSANLDQSRTALLHVRPPERLPPPSRLTLRTSSAF